ncbi:MAG: sulfotransferase [Planctomycetaceae bacterium]
MTPDFLIIGAMKAGTSTLRDHLRVSRDVFVVPQELHYFSDDAVFARGPEWYRTQFAGAGGAGAIGEKTASYCSSEKAARRIREHLPDVKLIWLFREPVARCYSHYWHSVQRGREPLRFADAVRAEQYLVSGDRERTYLRRSRYSEQVESYLELFPREQLFFVLFEEMVKQPAVALERVFRFLEVPLRDFEPATRHSHPTYGPRNPRVQWLTARLFGRGDRGWNVMQRINRRKRPGYPPMDDRLRAELREHFSDYNRKLGVLTGLDVSPWSASSPASEPRIDVGVVAATSEAVR